MPGARKCQIRNGNRITSGGFECLDEISLQVCRFRRPFQEEKEREMSASCMINMLLDFLEWDVVECEIVSYFYIYSYYLRIF